MTEGERLANRIAQQPFAQRVLEAVQSQVSLDTPTRTVIAVAGESGSGKTVTADALAGLLEASGLATVVLHQDDYFVRPPRANHAHRCTDLGSVGPHEVNLALLAEHVAAFRAAREEVTAPYADAATDRFLTRTIHLAAMDVLVVEGTYALLLPDSDVRIFLDATYQQTAERRRQRNRDVDAPIIDEILAIEHRLIAPQRARAHIVIDQHFALRR